MTDAGWEEAELDLAALADALGREAAFLAPVGELRVLGFGFYSRVLETESGWIVRVARTADAAYRHAYETRTLPALAPLLEVAIPEPVTALLPSEAAPFGAIAYRSLPGRVMRREETTEGNWQSLAQQLGQEVARLHDASLMGEVTAGLHTFDPDDFADLRAQIAAPLRARLTAGEWEKVDAWWEQFRADPTLRTWENVLTGQPPGRGRPHQWDPGLGVPIRWRRRLGPGDDAAVRRCLLRRGGRRVLPAQAAGLELAAPGGPVVGAAHVLRRPVRGGAGG
ncbi:MAG: phosphotransferase [Dehalococcoidia bacterium]